ncbi:MAG: permease prefix domain 1-containing protein [Coprococcus sp.]
METIKTYLENMFMSYPNTAVVCRAKTELLQMMEDKYMELKEEGKTENEAIGIVISEFGNIEELAEDLGIGSIVAGTEDNVARRISLEDAKNFLNSKSRHACIMALGIALCIISVCASIVADAYNSIHNYDTNSNFVNDIGSSVMIFIIAIGVGLIVCAGLLMGKWKYMKHENCQIDFETVAFVKQARESARAGHVILMIFGIIMCIISVVPVIVFDAMKRIYPFLELLSPASLFIFVAIGVFMIVYTSIRWSGYSTLLRLSDGEARENTFESTREKNITYENKTVAAIMSVYWTTVTCIYLCWSFLTFAWHITWIVWVLAAIIQMIIKAIFGKQY